MAYLNGFNMFYLNLTTTFISAITIVVMIAIFLLQKQTKKLSYKILLNTSLIRVSSEVKNKIEVYYENNKVENLRLLVIKFLNNGNQPISSADFEENINLLFSKDTRIIQCEVTDLYPTSLLINFSHSKNILTIKPLLLNSKEEFTFNIITDCKDGKFQITDRIKGVNIRSFKEPFFITNNWIFVPIAISISFFFAYYCTPIFKRSHTAEDTLAKISNLPIYAVLISLLFLLIISIPDFYKLYRGFRLKKR